MFKSLLNSSPKSKSFPKSKKLLFLIAIVFSFQSYAVEDTYCGNISGFEFSNGNSALTINNYSTYYIGDLPDNFYVDLKVDGYSESASFKVENLTTGQTYYVGENYLPYTFPGGNGAWNFGYGDFKVVAKIFQYNNCYGSYCDKEVIRFTISNSPQCGDIAGLQFSNGSDSVLIENNGAYDLSSLPNSFYLDILVDGFSESASLKVENLTTGQTYNVGENYLPYTAPGGNAAWYYGTGDFKVTTNIFEYNYCQGNSCDEEIVYFSLNDTPCGDIAGLSFTDGTTTVALTDGGVYDVNLLPQNFFVDLSANGLTESAGFKITNLDTGVVVNSGTNSLPYNYPNSGAWSLGNGNFRIKAEVFKFDGCVGAACDELTVDFNLFVGVDCGNLDQFVFANNIDATTTITDGGSYNLSDLPTDFYVDAIVAGASESVRLTVTNIESSEVTTIVENYIPYTYPAGGAAWNLGLGEFEVKAEVFSGNYCNSQLCDEQIITFTLTDIDDFVCTANVGSTVVDDTVFIFNVNQAFPLVNVTPSDDTVLPSGDTYSYACLLSKGSSNAIRYWSNGLSVAVEQPGNFKVHLLVYDTATLDLNTIILGQTLITDLANTISNDELCASLDESGISITVINGGDDERVVQTKTEDPVNDVVAPIEVVTKADQDVLGTDVKLYPNPVVDQLNVEINLTENEVMQYSMVDLNGKLVLNGIISSNFSKIETKDLATGLYILKLRSGSRSFTKKIVVNK